MTCAPAFAQGADNDDGNNAAAQYVDCSQVQVAVQNQYGNANANAGEGEATAEVAQELNISQEQVNACLGGSGSNDGDGDDNGGGGGDDADDDEGDVIAGSVPEGKLPNTGGPSLLVVAGLALVAGASLIRLRL